MAKVRPVVVLGAHGLVGSALMAALAPQSPLALTSRECDLTDPDRILKVMDRLRPRMFFNAAAFTDVDACETRPDLAHRINAVGPGHLAQAARETDCLLVHLSSDYVFDGLLNRPYREDDPARPLSEYGRSKLAGEKAVQQAGGDWLIIRTAWVFGDSPRGFPWRMLELAAQRNDLKVVHDQTGCPTYVRDLAESMAALVQAGARGIVHLVNGGQATWWELARRTLDLAGLPDVPLARTTAAEFGRPAPRPVWSVLDTGRYTELTGLKPRPWTEALAEALGRRK